MLGWTAHHAGQQAGGDAGHHAAKAGAVVRLGHEVAQALHAALHLAALICLQQAPGRHASKLAGRTALH